MLSYRELSGRVSRLAAGLLARGVNRGEHVALLMSNVPQFWESILACWHAGLVPVPINAKLHPREIAYILQHSESRLCLATAELAAGIDVNAVPTVVVASEDYTILLAQAPMTQFAADPEDNAWLFYTSGTTGQPKGAMLTHRNLQAMCLCYVSDIDSGGPWRAILHPAPLSHGSGLYGLAHLMKGSCQVIPRSGSFDAEEIFALIQAWPDCVFFAAPTMVRRLTTYPGEVDVSGLRAVIYGGAPMLLADVKAFIRRFGPRLAQLYGQGETPMTITGMGRDYFAGMDHPRWEQRLSSAGLPQSAVDVRVVGEDDRPLAAGECGEILVHGDTVMKGYWRNPEATADTLRRGWLRTGDLGIFDEEGFLTIQDRSKDVIISGGANIYPREVEEVLLQHPGVQEVSVIGKPDPEWGEIVVAYLSASPGARVSEEELDALCLANIARFKRPKVYRFVDEIPKNNYGKIQKITLREWEATL